MKNPINDTFLHNLAIYEAEMEYLRDLELENEALAQEYQEFAEEIRHELD